MVIWTRMIWEESSRACRGLVSNLQKIRKSSIHKLSLYTNLELEWTGMVGMDGWGAFEDFCLPIERVVEWNGGVDERFVRLEW